jgi:cobalt/nickel transport system permease protein
MFSLETYALRDSPLGRIHPGAKLLGAAVYIVCTVSVPAASLSGLVPYVWYPAVLVPLSEVPWKALVKRLAPVLPFALMGGLGNLFFMREPVLLFGGFCVSAGLISFAAIMLKAVLCAIAALLLIGSTPFHVLCAQLRRLRVPAVFCVQLAMMYRYIAVLLAEASSMYTAYTLRSAGGQRGVRIKDMGPLLGRLLLRSMDRAGRVYHAMQCRGLQGLFYAPRQPIQCADALYFAAVSGASIFFRFCNLPRLFGSLWYA